MRLRLLAEASMLGIVGLGSVFEGFRVIRARDLSTLSDVLGPGAYIVGLGGLLLLTMIGYVVVSLRSPPPPIVVSEEDGERLSGAKVLVSIAALCAYALLIDAVGYLLSTFLLLLVMSRVFGLSTWRKCAALAIVLAIIFHFVFVQFAAVAFPHGAIWG